MSYIQLAVVASLCVLAFAGPLGGGEIPEAFKNLTPDQKQQIGNIMKDGSLTKAQIKSKMDTYAATQPQSFQDAYKTLTNKFEEMKNADPTSFQGNSNLSADAKTLLQNIHAAKIDDNLTFQQTCDKVNGYINGASPTVIAELPNLKARDCAAMQNKFDNFLNGSPSASAAAKTN